MCTYVYIYMYLCTCGHTPKNNWAGEGNAICISKQLFLRSRVLKGKHSSYKKNVKTDGD